MNGNEMNYQYFDCSLQGVPCFELGIMNEDAGNLAHPGECWDDCNEARHYPYIREQLDKLTNRQIWGAIYEYTADHDDKENDREFLETFIIWIAAGNICEELAAA